MAIYLDTFDYYRMIGRCIAPKNNRRQIEYTTRYYKNIMPYFRDNDHYNINFGFLFIYFDMN